MVAHLELVKPEGMDALAKHDWQLRADCRPTRRTADGYLRFVALSHQVCRPATDRSQPEVASISALGAGPIDQVAVNAALRDTFGQGAHQAPDSVLIKRWTWCSGRIGICSGFLIGLLGLQHRVRPSPRPDFEVHRAQDGTAWARC